MVSRHVDEVDQIVLQLLPLVKKHLLTVVVVVVVYVMVVVVDSVVVCEH